MTTKRGLGSIRKLKSGRYQVRFTDPDGIRRNARTTFKTKASAEFELTRIREVIENGTWFVDETPQAEGLTPKTLTLKALATHIQKPRSPWINPASIGTNQGANCPFTNLPKLVILCCPSRTSRLSLST